MQIYMGSFKVKRLNLKKNVIESFERQNLRTCKDVLCLTLLELQSLFGISYKEALTIQNAASEKCVSDPCTVYDLYTNHQKSKKYFFPTSIDSLDALLQGGLLMGSVTEMSGPPGVGKSQFCFLLSLLATLRSDMGGLQGRVLYIDTEAAFSAQRLQKMALKKFPKLYKTERDLSCLLRQISVYRAPTICTLKEIVPNIEKEIIKRNVKLVIIDSIASLFRKEYGASAIQSVAERNNILVEQAAVLKDIAQTYNIVVFLTNQVTSHSADGDPPLPEILPPEGNEDEPLLGTSECCEPSPKRPRCGSVGSTLPALGVTWSHCVNTRLVATFLGLRVCQLTVAKSPVAPNAAVKYTLEETGFVLLDDGEDVAYINISDTEHQSILTKNHFLTEEITGPGVV